MAHVLIAFASTHGHTAKVADRIARRMRGHGVRVTVHNVSAGDGAVSIDATRRMIDELVEDTGWTPGRSEAPAGALQYREYDLFTRTLMRLLMRRAGHPTDTSRDFDYTDWNRVDQLADELTVSLDPGAAAPSSGVNELRRRL